VGAQRVPLNKEQFRMAQHRPVFGPGFMPSWHRPFLRYIENPDEGGAGETPPEPPEEPPTPGEESLGDAGKKALDAMKAERNAARQEAARVKAERDAFEAKLAGQEAEHAAQVERDRQKQEAIDRANQRVLKAEARRAATGKLSDPSDALTFLDLSQFEVGDDGEVDGSQIDAAIEALIQKKPYLAAQGGRRFEGQGEGGARNADQRPTQLTEADIDKMTPAQIVEAEAKGQLEDYLKS
jgi:hypothetical protein